MADGQEELPYGSAYLFNADAQAVLEEAPDLDMGLDLLSEAYGSRKWDKPEEAKEVMASYAQKLRYRFEDLGTYNAYDTMAFAPIVPEQIPVEGETDEEKNLNQINRWEEENLKKLETTVDPDQLLVREKLKRSIKAQASELRRDVRGRSTGYFEDKFYRLSLGLTGGIAKAVGADDFEKGLRERTDPSYDDDWWAAIASGAGSFAGALGSGAAGFAVGGPVGATAGAGLYLGGTGVGEVRERYQESLETTGDESRALGAAAIETGSQALQTVIGAKVFGGAGKAIGKKVFGAAAKEAGLGVGSKIAMSAGAEGISEAAGGVISQAAKGYGNKDPDIDLTENLDKNFIVGALFGGVSGGIETSVGTKPRPEGESGSGQEGALNLKDVPAPEEGLNTSTGVVEPKNSKVVGSEIDPEATAAIQDRASSLSTETPGVTAAPEVTGDFTTEDGNTYTVTPEGATKRYSGEKETAFQPLDRTFFVDTDKATRLAALRETTTPDGEPVQILTDGDSLIVKSQYVDEDLKVTESPTGRRLTVIPAETDPQSGLHPVEVNRPKNLNGNNREYRSHIGHKINSVTPRVVTVERPEGSTAGAAFTQERKLGARIRLSEGLDQKIRQGAGDAEFGYFRYIPAPNVETTNEAEKYINNIGTEAAVRDILTLPENYGDAKTVEVARQLVRQFNTAVAKANEAGDTNAAEEISTIAVQVGEKAAQILTNAGQTVQIAKLWQEFDPALRINFVRQKLGLQAIEETASEEGLSIVEIKNIDRNIEAVDEELAAIDQAADQELSKTESSFDKDIKDATELAQVIEQKAEETLKDFQAQEEGKAKELESKAETIELQATEKVSTASKEAEEGVAAAEKRIQSLEAKATKLIEENSKQQEKLDAILNKLEEKGTENAIKLAEKEVELAEGTLAKLKENKEKGARIKDETIKNAEESVNKLKEKTKNATAEEGLNPEERAELRKLRRNAEQAKAQPKIQPEKVLSTAEMKELATLRENINRGKERAQNLKKEGGLTPDQKEKIAKLKALAKKTRDEAKATTKENFLGAREKKQLAKLKEKAEEIKTKKATELGTKGKADFLNEAQKERLKELTQKKERLKKVQDKVTAKKKEKQSKLTPETADKITKLMKAAQTVSGSNQLQLVQKAFELENEILENDRLTDGVDTAYSYWQLNLLSDPSTQVVNFIGNAWQVLGSTLSYLVTGVPRGNADGLAFVRGLIRGATGQGKEAFFAELAGTQTFKAGDTKFEGGSKPKQAFERRQDFKNDIAPAWMKKIGLDNLGYVFRALSATDAFFYRTLQEGQAELVAYNEAKKDSSPGAVQKKVADRLFNSTENWNAAFKQAEEENKILKEVGIKQTGREVKLRAFEILEAKREQSLRSESQKFAEKGTFTNKPTGAVGKVVEAMGKINSIPISIGGKTIKPFRYLFPFMKVAGNILNANLDYTPIGLARSLSGNTDPKTALTNLEKRNAAGKFIIGTLLTGTIYGIAREFLDDDDPKFAISGKGPADANKRKQMMDQGWKPYSVKVGDKYFKYNETPLGIMLGALGSWMDQERYNKAYAQQTGISAVSTVLGGMGSSFVNNSFLKNISDFVKAVSGEEGVDLTNVLLVNPLKGFIPGVGALRAVSKLIEDPIDTKNDLYAKMVSGVPFVQNIGTRPALNAFGEPVERTFEDRLSFIGRFYSERTTDPAWRWLSENGYYVPKVSIVTKAGSKEENPGALADDVVPHDKEYAIIETAGPLIKEVVLEYANRYGSSGYQEAVQKRLSQEVAQIRRRVKQDLFLK